MDGLQDEVVQGLCDNPWFPRMIQENLTMERQIKMMRSVVDREKQRCNFKDMIVNNKLAENPDV